IAALHGGIVEAHSAGAGHGSRFVVRLPIAGGMAEVSQAPSRSNEQSKPSPGLKVLVADDNRDAADSLQRVLALYGHDVRVAYDGNAALEVGRQFRPRVAVLDIGM